MSMKTLKIIVALLLLIAIILGAYLLYNKLSPMMSTGPLPAGCRI